MGIGTKGLKTKIVEKDVEFVSKSKSNDLLIDTLLKEKKYSGLVNRYQEDKLPSKYLETVLLKDGFSKDRLEVFEKDTRNIPQEVVISPFNVKLSGETVSKVFFNNQNKVIDELKNEHYIDIKSAKDLAANFDKVGTPSMKIKGQNINQDDKKANELQKPIEEKTSQTSPKFETNKISQQELNELKTMTKEHLLYADPANVLNALGIDYKVEQGGSRYNFSIRAEDKTKSAFMYIGKSGAWQFKDFGSNQSGTIENVVMLATGMNYKDALNYSLDANGLKNLVSEAIDINKAQHQIQLTQEHRDKLEALKNANLEKHSKSDVHSRVVSYREITPKDTTVLNFLEARGIDGIPKDMFIIEGRLQELEKMEMPILTKI